MNITIFKADSRRMLRLSAELAGHVWRLYLTRDMKMRKTQARDNDATKTFVALKNRLMAERGHRCELCGNVVTRYMQMHHVLPYITFPQYSEDDRNMLLLCVDCHHRVHDDPFLQADLMLRKGAELGVDVRAAYGNPPYFSGEKKVIVAENH